MIGDRLVVCYHAVSADWPADLSVPPDALARQLEALVRKGYRGATLSDALAPGARRERLVAVTFDDAFASVLAARPVLERFDIPGTLFVPTRLIDRPGAMSWPGIETWLEGPHRDELRPLSWAQVGELQEAGWEMGSHTCTHPRLTQLDDVCLQDELRRSKADLEERTGRRCPTIAYPYGDVDGRVMAAAATAGYDIGVGLRPTWSRATPLHWPRVGVYRDDDLRRFRVKAALSARTLRVSAARASAMSFRVDAPRRLTGGGAARAGHRAAR
jgi:peptidoglycan/xylan/chitin deacetylase (PgdA/CDA1 family)